MSTPVTLRIGSRGSELALWQANHVRHLLGGHAEIVVIKTQGDQIQHLTLDKVEGKGFFTKELEEALLDRRVDLAVHSFKDLPVEQPAGLRVAATLSRTAVGDVVVARRDRVDPAQRLHLRSGACVGTSSLRRKAQLLSLRRDLQLVDLRGNVPTRLRKAQSGELDAVVLAEAGLRRLGLYDHDPNLLFAAIPVEDVCPAPAQGALAVQIRSDDSDTQRRVAALHEPDVALAVDVERRLLARFGGGCHLPLGAYCTLEGNTLHLRALVAAPDGSRRISAAARAPAQAPDEVVTNVHAQLVRAGAEAYL